MAIAINPIAAEIAKLELRPGDRVVVSVAARLHRDAIEAVRYYVGKDLPAGTPLIVLDNAMHLQVLRPTSEEQRSLATIREALLAYYIALDRRENGNTAQRQAFLRIEAALGLTWVPGATTFPAGAVLRYGDGETALLRVETASLGHGGAIALYHGHQCMGGHAGAYHEKCTLATAEDMATWLRHNPADA